MGVSRYCFYFKIQQRIMSFWKEWYARLAERIRDIKVQNIISDEGGLKDVTWTNNIWSGYKL
jgi:hypothetical protein